MPESFTDADLVPAVEPVRPRGWPLFSWAVIALLIAAVFWLRPREDGTDAPGEDPARQVVAQLQGRYLVGASGLGVTPGDALYKQVEPLTSTGSPGQRLRFITLAGELKGPGEALHALNDLGADVAETQVSLTDEQRRLQELLTRLYTDYAGEKWTAPSLRPEEESYLREQLGWFGRLALAPAGSPDTAERAEVLAAARRTLFSVLIVFIFFAGAGVAGFAGLMVCLVLLAGRRLQHGLRVGSLHGGIYAETFAVWMLLYIGLSVLGGLLSQPRVALLPASLRLTWSGLAMLFSLVALAWPVLRGVPWDQVRREVGWTAGRNPWVEILLGPAGYAMTLPMLAVGALVTLLLTGWLGGTDGVNSDNAPSHPIVGVVVQSGWLMKIQVVLLACVVAPLVEETMFRGVLYRHLRELSPGWGRAVSVLFSAAVVSLVFAAVHPQGVLAIPALAALAFGFTLLREWRETLIPSMIAHGINNGVIMLLLLTALG